MSKTVKDLTAGTAGGIAQVRSGTLAMLIHPSSCPAPRSHRCSSGNRLTS